MKHNFILAVLFLFVLASVYPQRSKEVESANDIGAGSLSGSSSANANSSSASGSNSSSNSTSNSNASSNSGSASPSRAAANIPVTALALSSPDYRVTAGDIYTLVYTMATTPVTFRIVVDSTYRIQIANLGVINAAGKTYRQLKTEAETIVSNNYPLSGAQFALTQAGLFQVYLAGEVKMAATRQAWALARLSALLEEDDDVLTPYSSIRDVTITSSSGETRTYDLFKAQRDGDMSQDPYLRPEDKVRVNRVDRVVTVEGAVERPGTYQLLPGENLKELITRYASNFKPTANPNRMELVRFLESESDSGDKLYLSAQNVEENYPLRDLDELTVPSVTDLMPVMFVEGAIQGPTTQGSATLESAESNVANRLPVRFNQGENYSSLVQRNRLLFTAISDTRNAYIIRDEERIPLNINLMLYDSSYLSRYFVERNDVLIIPFRQYFVTVAGAVALPGRYPYIPDRSWDYYVALAGGFVRERNAWESVAIQDMSGKTMRKTDPIMPETTITARTNAVLYYFNQYAPVVTSLLSIVTTFISVMLLTR